MSVADSMFTVAHELKKKEGTRQLALVLNQNNIVCCLPHFEKKKKLFAIASVKNHNMFFLRCKKRKALLLT